MTANTEVAANRNPDLETKLRASPDDESLAMVYADWLQSQGDPRGEWMAVQHARTQGDSDELRAKDAQIMEEHREALLGPLARVPPRFWEADFRSGLLHSLRLNGGSSGEESKVLLDALPEILEHPMSVRLRELSIYNPDPEGLMKAFLGQATPPPLSGFALISGAEPCTGDDLAALAKWYPNLERLGLWVNGREFPWDQLNGSFPGLRELELVVRLFQPNSLPAIASLTLPLESLVLDLFVGDLRQRDLTPFLGVEALPKLTKLGIFGAQDRKAVVKKFASSERLKVLRQFACSLEPESKECEVFEVFEVFEENSGAFEHVALFAPNARDAGSLCGYAYALLDLERTKDAFPVVQRAVRMEPNDEEHWYLLARCQAWLGDHGQALAALAKAIELDEQRDDDEEFEEEEDEDRIKDRARDDEDFEVLSGDARFLELVR